MHISLYLRTGAVEGMKQILLLLRGIVLNGHGQQAREVIHFKKIKDQDMELVLLLILHPILFGECLVSENTFDGL